MTCKDGEAWVQTQTAMIRRRQSGLLELRFKDGSCDDTESAQANVEVLRSLTEGRGQAPLLAVLDGLLQTTPASRRISRDGISSFCSTVGLVAQAPVSRVIGEVFLRVTKPDIPVELFGNEQAALSWLGEGH